MGESNDLRLSVEGLEDSALQRRFSALFDEGQGDNARRAFISYCNSRGYHPSEMKILCGNNLFERMERMLHKQKNLIESQKAINIWLMQQATKLNGGKAVIPPKSASLEAAAVFRRLVTQKLGPIRGARAVASAKLGLSTTQFTRLMSGADVSELLIDRLEDLPDWVPSSSRRKHATVRKSTSVDHPRFLEIERRFRHIPKPRKHQKSKTDMTVQEFTEIAESWFGKDWLVLMSMLIGYNKDHLSMMINGDNTRYLTKDTGDYIRRIQAELSVQGGFNGLGLPLHQKTRLRSGSSNKFTDNIASDDGHMEN